MLTYQYHQRRTFVPLLAPGFTLLEVLIALFVLSVGLLGLATLQATSLRYNSDSYFRTQSNVLAYDIMDRMRANVARVTAGDYDASTKADVDTKRTAFSGCANCKCDASPCNAQDLALYDLGKWYEKQDRLLPGAKTNPATISRDPGTNLVTIRLRWVERDLPFTQSWEFQP